jgi:hypothetical protein
MGTGMGVLLFTAVTGYWVLERAERQKKSLRKVGRIVGTLVIIVSFFGVACSVACKAGVCGKAGWKKAGCPLSGKVLPARP